MPTDTTSRFTRARAETIAYHSEYYGKHQLFKSGSWLENPDPKVPELIKRVSDTKNCRVLDLGAGVGRNAIVMAKELPADARVTCIELIPEATDLLRKYAVEHGVAEKVVVINDDFENVTLPESEFHLVLGISTLEHCSNHENLVQLVRRFQNWTAKGGINYMNFSTNRAVNDFETGKPIETQVETRLDTEGWLKDLSNLYADWNLEILGTMEPYSEVLMYNGRQVVWSSDEMEILAVKS